MRRNIDASLLKMSCTNLYSVNSYDCFTVVAFCFHVGSMCLSRPLVGLWSVNVALHDPWVCTIITILVIPSVRYQLVKMFITLEPHGI